MKIIDDQFNYSYSLTRRLSFILLVITASVWVGSLGCIYWGMQRTANNIFDKSLAETAHALLSTTSSSLEGRIPDHTVIEKAQGEHYNQIIFQIWHRNGKLIYRSVGVDTHPFVQQANFGWIKIHNQTYRSYSVWDSTHTIQVQIAQVWTIRQDIQRDMLLFLIVVSAFFTIIVLADFAEYTQSFVHCIQYQSKFGKAVD
jgi:hypothetical protein